MTEQFVKWLESELQRREISQRTVSRKTKIANSTISYWLAGRHEPDDVNISLLANYFDVDKRFVYELLGRLESTSTMHLDEDEIRMVEKYRSLRSAKERRRFLRLAEVFLPETDEEAEAGDPQFSEA